MTTNLSPIGGSAARALFTPLSILITALLWMAASAGAAQEVDTQITNSNNSDTIVRYFNTQNSPTALSLSDVSPAAKSPWASSSVTVSYGSATVTGDLVMPAYNGQSITAQGIAKGNWTDTYTINNAALTGTNGTIQVTYHLTGSFIPDATLPGTTREDEGNFFVNDGSGANVGYDGSSQGAFDKNVGNYQNFVLNQAFTFGTAFDLHSGVSINVSASNGQVTSGANFHANLTLTSGSYSVLNGSGVSVAFAGNSNTGSAAGTVVASGSAYAGIALTDTVAGSHGTVASVLGGTASANKTITETFLAAPVGFSLASDAVDFSGTLTDKYVLQLKYDPAAANALFGSVNNLVLEWLNPATNTWVNAISGNSDGGLAHQRIVGAYNTSDFVLGDYGIDTTNNTVWAVIDHNSEFGVAQVVPEPSSWAALLGGLGLLLGIQRWRGIHRAA